MQHYNSVEEYLNAQPADFKLVLEKLRAQIKAAAPKAEESISYGMPAYKYKGALVYSEHLKIIAAFSREALLFWQTKKDLRVIKLLKAQFSLPRRSLCLQR